MVQETEVTTMETVMVHASAAYPVYIGGGRAIIKRKLFIIF